MSLQIWLPLNKQGDFTNRGVGELNITSNTAQYNNEGKIGGCVLCNSSQRLTFTCQDWFKFNPSTKFSVALWIKGCISSESYVFACNSWELRFQTNTIRFYPSQTSSYYPVYWNTTVDPDKWYHICGTWDGHKSCLYVDGELKCTTEIPNTATFYDFYDHKNFYLTWSNTSYINDFRLYDHSLSQEEVKEISQGLVVHYKLNDICGKNLFVFENRKYTQDNPYVWTSAGTDAYSTGCRIKALDLVPGKTYTFSCCTDREIGSAHNSQVSKNKVTLWLYLYHTNEEVDYTYNSSTDKAIAFVNINHSYKEEGYNRYSWRYAIPDGYQACCVRVNHYSDGTNAITSKYWDFKLEEGDVYTPDMWDGVSYDSSGYNIDGTITGNLTIQSDSPRYDKCVINTENKELLYTPINFPESCGATFNFWTKASDYGHQFSGMIATSSNSIPTDYYATALHQYDKCFRLTGTNGSQLLLNISKEEIPINQWKMITITHDGNLVKLYIDGEFIRSGVLASNLVGFNSLFLGWSKAGGLDRYYKGGWSDFRIYSTALSADDVKDLYETSASIDNRGTLHAREIVENTENLFTLENLLETVNTDRWTPGSNDHNDPRWVMRNGQAAMSIGPNPFWWGAYTDSIHHLGQYFKAGKQYKIDLWIDADDIYRPSLGRQALGGIRLVYTDGSNTSNNLCVMGDVNNPKGFQHVTYYTDPTKTVRGIHIYYDFHNPAYYRSDSSITEVKDVDIQKCGIVEAPWLVDTEAIIGTRSQYDTNIYEESDGSRWVRIFHHANPSSDNLFSSTDTFSSHVYKDANRWFDVSICNQLSSWELMIKQKPSSTGTLQKYRWKQYVNPMLATESDVSADKVIYDTSTGYTSCAYKGLYKFNKWTYLSQGDYWFGAVGCWSVYDSGIPGWNKTTISSTGYMDLYVRIDDTFQKETNIYDNKIECNSFIEN